MMKPIRSMVIVMGILTGTLSAQPAEKPKELELLHHYVGQWDAKVSRKSAEDGPEELKYRSSIVSGMVLDGWFLESVKNSSPVDAPQLTLKSLSLTTFDLENNKYVTWDFFSIGRIIHGTASWDPQLETQKWHAEQAREPLDAKTRFIDKNTIHSEFSRQNEEGQRLSEIVIRTRKKGKLPDFTRALWDKIEKPILPVPDEVKQLKPLIGEWKADYIHYPSQAFPQGHRTETTITNRWILDGRFLLGRAKFENYETLWVMGYDSDAETYRYIRFDSNGDVEENVGSWKPEAREFTWKVVNGGPGVEKTAKVTLIGNHRVQSKIRSMDAEGKVLLDLLIRSERKE